MIPLVGQNIIMLSMLKYDIFGWVRYHNVVNVTLWSPYCTNVTLITLYCTKGRGNFWGPFQPFKIIYVHLLMLHSYPILTLVLHIVTCYLHLVLMLSLLSLHLTKWWLVSEFNLLLTTSFRKVVAGFTYSPGDSKLEIACMRRWSRQLFR